MDTLYFCDGHACDDKNNDFCYMHDGLCTHTTDIRHSLSHHIPDFPPTKFVPLIAGETTVEKLDTIKIFKQLSNGNTLKLVKG